MNEEFYMELIGIARDAHPNYPIKFGYGEQSGTAFFTGCKVEAQVERGGKSFTKRMDVRAFGEIAEQIAHVVDGTPVTLKGTYDMNKGKDDKFYPVVTVTEVISA